MEQLPEGARSPTIREGVTLLSLRGWSQMASQVPRVPGPLPRHWRSSRQHPDSNQSILAEIDTPAANGQPGDQATWLRVLKPRHAQRLTLAFSRLFELGVYRNYGQHLGAENQ